MKKHQTLACGLLSSLLMTACDSGLEAPSSPGTTPGTSPGTTQVSQSMNLRMPKSLQSSDDSAATTDASLENESVNDGVTDAEDTRESVRETMGDISEVAGVLDAAATGASTQALYLGADLIYERVEFAEEILDDIDDNWDAIMDFCASYAAEATCEIPGNTLVDEDGEIIDDATIVYQATPETGYAHSISRTSESEGNEFEHIQWNDDRSRISMSYNGDWLEAEGTAEHRSQLIYTEADDGIRVSLRDEFAVGNSSFTDLQQLHALNDELNGIEIITEFNWREGDDSGQWQSHAVVNDQGGKLGTTATFANAPVIWHTRETFDENGDLASSEYCEQTDGIDCSDSANWQQADFEFVSAVETDFEDADYDLHEAYLQACEEMEVDGEACGFSESEMVIIDGAYDLFENTDDVIVYLCIETGEDELVCRSEDDDTDTTSQFPIDPDNFTDAGTAFGTEANGVAAIQECEDCTDSNLIKFLFANPELDVEDLEGFDPESFDSESFDLGSFDLGSIGLESFNSEDLESVDGEFAESMVIDLFNAVEAIDAEYECDTNETSDTGITRINSSEHRLSAYSFSENGANETYTGGKTLCVDVEDESDGDDQDQDQDEDEDEENDTDTSE